MPFSIEWFLTLPGMLISIGILLLVVAFIMFLIGSGDAKDKSKKDKPKSEMKIEEPKNINFDEVDVSSKGNDNSDNSDVEIIEINNNIQESVMKSQEPKVETVEIDDGNNDIEFKETINLVNDEIPEVVEINFDNVQEKNEQNQELGPKVIKTEEKEIIEIIDDVPKVEKVEIEPTVIDVSEIKVTDTVSTNEEEKHQIYGGADPLDATKELPKVDIRHVPYSGGKVEVAAPTVERIPDDFAFKPMVEEEKVEVEPDKEFIIEPIDDNSEDYKFSTNVIEIPDNIEDI